MADAKIVVEVQGKGAKVVKRDLDQLTKSGTNATSAMNLLKRSLLGIGSAQVIRGVVRTADAYTNMTNKLKVATEGQEEFSAALESVKAISRDTFTDVEAVANSYSRFEIATKDLGKSQQEVADFTKVVAQTFRVSGATAQETTQAMIQLGQGLASGALRGDEFRSVAEANATLLNTLAQNLGKTRGELKEMADAGEITSDVLFSGLLPSMEALNTQAEQIAPTFEKAFGRLKDEVLLAIGESETLNSAMDNLVGAVILLSENLDVLGNTVGIVAAAFIGLKLVTVIGAIGALTVAVYGNIAAFVSLAATVTTLKGGILLLQASFISLNAAILANPIGLFVAAVVAAGTAIYIFRDDIKEAILRPMGAIILAVDEAIKKLREFANYVAFSFQRAVGSVLVATGQISSDDLDAVLKASSEARSFDTTQSNFGNFTTDQLADALVDLAGSSKGGTNKPAGTAGQLAGNVKDATTELNEANTAAKKLVDTIDDGNDRTKEFANAAGDAFDQFIDGTLSASDALRSLGQELINLARQELFGSSGGTLGGILSSVLGSVFSTSGGGGSGGLFGGIIGSIGSILPAFNNGGSMVLGGNGGVDNNLLSLNNQPIARVSAGETMNITPRGGSGGGTPVVVNQTINVTTGIQQTVRAEIARLMPAIQQQATKGVEEAKMRGAILS